jgi:hypothetical protein
LVTKAASMRTAAPPSKRHALAASTFVRAAIPDLRADLLQMIVAGDRVTVHYRFHGHFTGRWAQTAGTGQAVDSLRRISIASRAGRLRTTGTSRTTLP